jgi:hypothetical protein
MVGITSAVFIGIRRRSQLGLARNLAFASFLSGADADNRGAAASGAVIRIAITAAVACHFVTAM